MNDTNINNLEENSIIQADETVTECEDSSLKNEVTADAETLEAEDAETKQEETSGPQNEIQRFYEHFRNVPLRYIDIFIGVCFVGLFAVVILGMLKSRGII